MNDSFLLTLHGPVAHLQLNRPDRANALAPLFFTALRDAVRKLGEGGAVHALVISSTGAQFSAGLATDANLRPAAPAQAAPRSDRRNPNESAAREAVGAILQMLDEPVAPSPAQRPGHVSSLHALAVLAEAPFPVICAVQGGCDGAALALACAADIRVCSADASFTPHDECSHGHTTDPAVLQALARLLPPGLVRELAYTGGRLHADQAHQLGFVNAVLPDATRLVQHALSLAARMAAHPPQALAAAKLALRNADALEGVALVPVVPLPLMPKG